MIISIRDTIRAFLAPQYKITCPPQLWEKLRSTLAERGDGVRESGAFLLGHQDKAGRRIVESLVPYDDLDPDCLNSGIVRFSGSGYGPLFALCRERGQAVVADIHTHGGEAYLSGADRDHPMMSQIGHIALIMPGFAMCSVPITKLGIYRYEGRKQWQDWSGPSAPQHLRIGW